MFFFSFFITIMLLSNNVSAANKNVNELKKVEQKEFYKFVKPFYNIIGYGWIFDGDCIQMMMYTFDDNGNLLSAYYAGYPVYVGQTRFCPSTLGAAYC